MKVALCLSGHTRSFKECHDSLDKHILSKYNPDVFIHTWDDVGFFTNPSNYRSSSYKTTKEGKVKNEDWNLLKNVYSPKNLIIENQSDIDVIYRDIYSKRSFNKNPKIFSYQLYTIHRSINLALDYHTKYDVIIRARFDQKYRSFEIPENIENNILYLSDYGNGASPENKDQVAFGSEMVMEKYGNTYNKIDSYVNYGCLPIAESLFSRQLNRYDITTKRLKGIQFGLVRENGSIHQPPANKLKGAILWVHVFKDIPTLEAAVTSSDIKHYDCLYIQTSPNQETNDKIFKKFIEIGFERDYLIGNNPKYYPYNTIKAI